MPAPAATMLQMAAMKVNCSALSFIVVVCFSDDRLREADDVYTNEKEISTPERTVSPQFALTEKW